MMTVLRASLTDDDYGRSRNDGMVAVPAALWRRTGYNRTAQAARQEVQRGMCVFPVYVVYGHRQ
jgi:hypothetical protein